MCLGSRLTLLTVSNISAVFDAVDHSILLQSFWHLGTYAQLDPFLRLRPLSFVPHTFWYPAGICLSPAFYILYTADLGRILSKKGLPLISMLMTPRLMFMTRLL